MAPTPSADRVRTAPCRCGHDRDLHEHDRPGSDCGIGGPAHCAAFRHATPVLHRLLARFARPAAADPDHTSLAPVHALAAARSARVARTARARVVASDDAATAPAAPRRRVAPF